MHNVLLVAAGLLAQEHHPIDIQTTIAGPGAGTNKEIVCLRMVEIQFSYQLLRTAGTLPLCTYLRFQIL